MSILCEAIAYSVGWQTALLSASTIYTQCFCVETSDRLKNSLSLSLQFRVVCRHENRKANDAVCDSYITFAACYLFKRFY